MLNEYNHTELPESVWGSKKHLNISDMRKFYKCFFLHDFPLTKQWENVSVLVVLSECFSFVSLSSFRFVFVAVISFLLMNFSFWLPRIKRRKKKQEIQTKESRNRNEKKA